MSKFRYTIFPEHIYLFEYDDVKYEVKGSQILEIVKDYLKITDDTHSNNDTRQTK